MNVMNEIERKLRELVKALESSFLPSETNEVISFVDVGEYGIALETICFIIAEEKKDISYTVYSLIEEAGCKMQMDPRIWGQLKQ
jgi:hypothetical protein